MTSGQILELLSQRHTEDLFVPECKDGPTQMGSHFRLDAWVMKKSWVRPKFTGYEIKVSRSDWLKDLKVQEYMSLCNELWVVAPPGIVQVEELPQSVGLLIPASTGSRFLTKRKAVYRDIDPPVSLLLYVLMCRVRVQRHLHSDVMTREERADQWRERLESESAFTRLGYNVSHKLRAQTIEKVAEAERRAGDAELKLQKLEKAAEALKKLGVNYENCWRAEDSIKRALENDQVEALRAIFRQGLSIVENS